MVGGLRLIRLYAILISLIFAFSPVVSASETYYIGFLGNTNNAASNAMYSSLKFAIDSFNLTKSAYSVAPQFFSDTDPASADSIKNSGNLIGVIGSFGAGTKNVIDNVTDIPLISAVSENSYFNVTGRANLFRTAASDAQLAADTCRFLIAVSLKAKLAVVYSSESDEYARMAQAFKNTADRNKIWSQYFKEVEADRKDFTAVLLRLRDLKVHNIYFAGNAFQAAALARQSSDMNVGADFSSTHLICTSAFIKTAKAGAQGAVFAAIAPSSLYGFKQFRPALKEFTKVCKSDDIHIPYVYDSANLLLNCLSIRKTDKSEILKYIRNNSFDGVTGAISFKENGDRSNPPSYFYIIRNKDFLQRSLMGSETAAFNSTK
jgi:branched-chain amino acid transport system substrate-binding protein